MLSKKKRVTKKIFHTIMKNGKFFSTPLFLFYFLESKSPKYVFVAPKNIYKTAVKRNKARRFGYNNLRSLSLGFGNGIFIYKKQTLNSNKQEIKENIFYILKKINALK